MQHKAVLQQGGAIVAPLTNITANQAIAVLDLSLTEEVMPFVKYGRHNGKNYPLSKRKSFVFVSAPIFVGGLWHTVQHAFYFDFTKQGKAEADYLMAWLDIPGGMGRIERVENPEFSMRLELVDA